jgi:hypothetical protein
VNPSVLSVLRADGTEVAPLRAVETREFPVREVWGRKLNAPLSCRQIIGHYPLDVLDEGIKVRVDALPLNYRKAIVTVSSEFRFELAAVR